MPSFHALLAVRDESDIIQECLTALLKWADSIFIFDTGSIDSTWEIINEMAISNKAIVPLKKDNVYFSENLVRGWLFHSAREKMQDGDWFLRVDADEFHHISPKEFAASYLNKNETLVFHQYYHFCLLESEAEHWLEGTENTNDRKMPIAQRRRWYFPLSYSEPRMCRYRTTMKWSANVSFPYNSGVIAKERLPIRHYPIRDLGQLKRRCTLRSVMHEDSNRAEGSFAHWVETDWKKYLTIDNAEGLKYWNPADPLELVHHTNHLGSKARQIYQKILHKTVIRYMDRKRGGWEAGDYPSLIPPNIISKLTQMLGAGN
jgi:glycosyltransferase involved in cell wall biosynthesis